MAHFFKKKVQLKARPKALIPLEINWSACHWQSYPGCLPRWGAIISLHVLQEAEEQRVDCHGVDAEEGGRDEVRSNDNEDDWHEEVVQGRNVIVQLRNLTGEDKVGHGANAGDDHQFA